MMKKEIWIRRRKRCPATYQNWLFNRLMERLWPDLLDKKVVFHELP